MNYEEMLTWILFYRSILATTKLPMVESTLPNGNFGVFLYHVNAVGGLPRRASGATMRGETRR